MVLRGSQVGGVSTVAAAAFVLIACDSPARVKPWRHAPDPTTEAARHPGSPVLAEAPSEAAVLAGRPHTLRIHMDSDPGKLSPVIDPSLWARRILIGTVYEPLLRYVPGDANGPARYTGRLARSWRVLPGGQEIRIELQPGVTWHDGRQLTSSDVLFTLDRMRDSRFNIRHLRPMLEDIETVELVAPLELRVRLKRPSGWILRALAEIPILPYHIHEGSLAAGGAIVGTGPWKLASNKGGVVHLTAYDKHWAGAPAIADIEFVHERDAAVVLTAAKRGELDIVPALVPAHWPEQASAPGLAAAFKPLQLAPPKLRFFRFNAAHPVVSDPRVRHAFALLVDRRAISKRVFDGLARPICWPIWPGGPVDGPEAPIPDFDPAAAAKLLDASGWVDTDKDGIRDQGPDKPLKIVLLGIETNETKDSSGPPEKTERDYFVDAARRAGIVLEVRTGGESWVDKKLEEGAWDITEVEWAGRVDMDISSMIAGTDGTYPEMPGVTRTLQAMGLAWDPAERGKLAKDLVTALDAQWPIAGIVADAPQGLVHQRVENVRVWDGWIDLSQLKLTPSK